VYAKYSSLEQLVLEKKFAPQLRSSLVLSLTLSLASKEDENNESITVQPKLFLKLTSAPSCRSSDINAN